MLFKLANERPSEATDVYGDSIKTSHSSAFGGNRPRVRDQDKIKSILYQFKSFFFPATSRITQGSSIEIEISCGDSCHNPQAAPFIQCGHLQSGRWGQSHFQRPVCLQTGHAPGDCFWHSQAQWLIDLHFAALCLAGFTSRQIAQLPRDPLGCPEVAMRGWQLWPQFSLSPSLPVFTSVSLFLLSLISVIKYLEGHL